MNEINKVNKSPRPGRTIGRKMIDVWVAGKTYPHRHLLQNLGFRWDAEKRVWVGRTYTTIRAHLIRMGLNVPVRFRFDNHSVTNATAEMTDTTEMGGKPDTRDRIETYNATPLLPEEVDLGKNINLRRCHWGSPQCQDCLECVAGLDVNDPFYYPEPDPADDIP